MLNFYLPSIIFSCLFTFSFYFSFSFLSLFSTHSHKKSGKFTPKTWYESGIFLTFGCRFPPKSTNFGTLSSRAHRKEEVQLCRLRIGHTLATHRYLLCGDGRPRCPRCGDNLSVAHALVSCRRLAAERQRFFGSTSLSLKELLGNESGHITQIFRFLSEINFSIIFTQT